MSETDADLVFVIDTAESSASYEIFETFFGESESVLGRKVATGDKIALGTTPEVAGQIGLIGDPGDLAGVTGTITANLQLLATDQKHRDGMLRQYWLVSNEFPTATFKITSASGLPAEISDGETVEFDLTGDLTIRETTREIVFRTEATLNGERLVGRASTSTLMTDFGIDPPAVANAVTVEDPFNIYIDLVAIRQR